jgi:deoxyribodipyrimidine photolyase
MWFRADLRTADNPALFEAARRADRGVVAVFTICPGQWRSHDMAPIKVDFVLRNLQELSAALAKKSIALRIVEADRFRDVPEALLELARQHECDALFYNREYEVNERRRDGAVTEAFERAGLGVRRRPGSRAAACGAEEAARDGGGGGRDPGSRRRLRSGGGASRPLDGGGEDRAKQARGVHPRSARCV